jgi:hypothetical protein
MNPTRYGFSEFYPKQQETTSLPAAYLHRGFTQIILVFILLLFAHQYYAGGPCLAACYIGAPE